MKIILAGYPGSQWIRKASEYLTGKYLFGFDVIYLNYTGEIQEWSKFIANYLKSLDDKFIIFALDDYLLAAPIDFSKYHELKDAVCAKLCVCSVEENQSYPVTTQYTIWNKEYLISLLDKTTTPWDFEINGSRIFKSENQKMLHIPALKYFTNSSLSAKWEGINLVGLNDEDIKKVQELI